MTPQEINTECRAILDGLDTCAKIFVNVSDSPISKEPAQITLYPRGMGYGGETSVSVSAVTFEEAFASLRAKWAEVRADHDHETLRRMALRIIRITDEQGECTDAALRQHFDPNEIKRLGSEALTLADKMAAGGPFTIVATRGQNAA